MHFFCALLVAKFSQKPAIFFWQDLPVKVFVQRLIGVMEDDQVLAALVHQWLGQVKCYPGKPWKVDHMNLSVPKWKMLLEIWI